MSDPASVPRAVLHWERPMFGNRLACGRRRGRLFYSWLSKPTCKVCLRAWRVNR